MVKEFTSGLRGLLRKSKVSPLVSVKPTQVKNELFYHNRDFYNTEPIFHHLNFKKITSVLCNSVVRYVMFLLSVSIVRIPTCKQHSLT